MKRRFPLGLLALGLVACGDGTVAPDEAADGLTAPDTVLVHAVRDTFTLEAEVVYTSGRSEPATGAVWSGCGGGVAVLSPDGLVRTVGAGECSAVVSWGGWKDTVTVAVRRRGVVTLTFDDGWKSARTVALPVLAGEGLVANVAVVPATAVWPAYLSVGDMEALHAAGWSFVSHTMTHDSLPSLSDEDLAWQIREPIRWLQSRGLRAADVLVVPYHLWGEREEQVVSAAFSATRGRTADYYWPEFLAEWRPQDPHRITCIDGSALARTADGRQEIMAYVEHAIAQGLMVDIMFHDVRPEDEPGFRQLAEQLAPYADRIRTWHDLFPLQERH